MIEDLQEINRFGDKKHLEAALAKQREMKRLMLADSQKPVDNKTRLRNKYNRSIAQNAMKHYEEKYGVNPGRLLLSEKEGYDYVKTQQD
mmetsp:Transcript_16559/g.28174  ORF Transcript_16559/g.28174 Transcript_16559/m.28174 type:complete len:89 (-) Transcript_16559:215-481(-)